MSAISSPGAGASVPATTNLIKGNGGGGALAAVPGADYLAPSTAPGAGSTFLRPDGSSAATLAGTATIAATGNLLMGDSAGNAVAALSPTLYHVAQARLDAIQAAAILPTNLLSASNLAAGTINADGTMTIPAGGNASWSILVGGADAANTPLYGYAVATTDTPFGALRFRVRYGVDHDSEAADSTLAPGAYRTRFLNMVGVYAYNINLNNVTASPITVFFPVVALQDTGLSLLASHADLTAVATQPVSDLDFTRFADADRSARYQLELRTTLAADSVNGSAGNAGTLYNPKASTVGQTIVNGNVVGLYRGSTFRESLPLPTTATTHGIVVQDLALGSVKPLPVISALDMVPTSSITNNGDGSYSYLWTPVDTLDNGGYSNVYMVEINTGLEVTQPIAARHRMVDVSSQSAVVTAGNTATVWIQSPGTGTGQSGSTTQWKAIFHGSFGVNPISGGTYRYEVVSRVQPANWGSFAYNQGDGAMSGLELVGGNSGYGALSAPRGFVGDRLIFVHASTHNAVINGGSLQRSVLYESGDLANGHGPSIQLAWYADQGAGLRWDTRHCLFYMNVGDRYANGIISHTSQSGGGTYDQGDISDCAFLGARWSDGSLQGTGIDYVNVAAGTINRVYVQNVRDAFGSNMPLASEVKNSVFRGVHRMVVGNNFHDNVVQTVNGGDPNSVGNRNPNLCVLQQSGASATNNLLWAHTDTVTGQTNDDQVGGVGFAGDFTNCTFSRNIVVLDPATATVAPTYMLQLTNQSSLHIDYNLVINLAKAGISAQGPGGGYVGWPAYLAGYPLLDQHSLYVDLSSDPRGLKAVFADPANGDFRWAQTDVARRCAAYCRANNVGPAAVTSRWPVVPSVDEAVRLLTLA